jgi:hypothetical protein
LRLENPKSGLVIYPKLEKDADGNWQISNLDAVKKLLGTDQPEKPPSEEETVRPPTLFSVKPGEDRRDD